MFKRNQTDICGYLALTLAIVGGLNWGLIGIADFNVVERLCGYQTLLTKCVYISVGVSSVYLIIKALKTVLETGRV